MVFSRSSMPKISVPMAVMGSLFLMFSGFFWLPKWAHRDVFYIFMTLTLFSAWRPLKDEWLGLHRRAPFLVAFLGYSFLLALIFSLFSLHKVLISIKLVSFGLFFILALPAILKTDKDWSALLFAYVATALVTGAALCVQYYAIEGHFFLEAGERLKGLGRGMNPNVAGMLYALAGVIAYAHGPQWQFLNRAAGERAAGHDYRALFKWAAFGVCALTVLATQSRGSLLAFGAALFVLWCMEKRYKLVTAALCAALALFFGVVTLQGDFSNFLTKGDNLRFEIWMQAWEIIQAHWLFGVGYTKELLFKSSPFTWASTHNVYLGLLVYEGVIGLALFLLFWGAMFITLYKRARHTGVKVFVGIMVYASVYALFELHTPFVNLNPEWLLFWFPAAYMLYLKRRPA